MLHTGELILGLTRVWPIYRVVCAIVRFRCSSGLMLLGEGEMRRHSNKKRWKCTAMRLEWLGVCFGGRLLS